MNSCVLMVKVIRNPQLRYTQDNQTPVAEMLVEFAGLNPNDEPSTLKVVGWGNLATKLQESYHEGDSLIIEGRLSMRVIERPEGYKEKRAELIASRFHSLNSLDLSEVDASPWDKPSNPDNVVTMETYQTKADSSPNYDDYETAEPVDANTSSEIADENLDDIPF